eukprot:scaffold3166_cov399-Prasinococcus_capsulatus_cf.AAC.10
MEETSVYKWRAGPFSRFPEGSGFGDGNVDTLLTMATVFYRAGRWAQAEIVAREYQQRRSTDVRIYRLLASIISTYGCNLVPRDGEAKLLIQQALRIEPSDEATWTLAHSLASAPPLQHCKDGRNL